MSTALTPKSIHSRSLRRWGPLAIFVVALAVRLYGLTYHSLWFDEVMSTFWAARPVDEIWRVGLSLTQDKHPPLYYLALHAWTALFGPGDAAVRALGAVIGALAVFPTYGIGLVLGGRRAAALGALLLAINPFLAWYSQEARMFMPATTFGLVGLWGILRIAEGRRRKEEHHSSFTAHFSRSATPHLPVGAGVCYLLFVICGLTAALYTYLFSAFLLPVAGVWVLLAWWVQRREQGAAARLGLGLASLAAVAILFLPLARSAWLVSGGESTPGRAFGDMMPALWRMLGAYAVGWPHWPDRAMMLTTAGAAVLAAVGIWGRGRGLGVGDQGSGVGGQGVRSRETGSDRRRSAVGGRPSSFFLLPSAFLPTWLAIPVLLGGILLARDRTVFAETRYFIFLVPALCLAWGRALARLWQRGRAAGLAFTALAFGITLAALPADWSPENRREAWREAAAFVQANAGPDDAVLIQADYVHVAFRRYFSGSQPIFQPFTDRLDDPAQVEGPLAGLADFETVWLVQSHHQELDPGNLVAGWFGARYPLVTEVFPPGIAIRAFAQRYRQPAAEPAPGGTLLAAGQLHLVECRYQPVALPAQEDVFHPPSNWIHATTHWQIGGNPPGSDLFPRARLVDAAGQVWGEGLDRPNSALRIWPTSRWLRDETVRVDYDVNLNPITPPGQYRLIVEMPGEGEQAGCGNVMIVSKP